MTRIACLLTPLFPLAARLRSEPELKQEALAIFCGSGPAARLVAATRSARQAGLRPGQTLNQARALLPRLVARARDAACEQAAREALLETAEQFSPRVEDAGEGRVYLDLHGLERHFPSELKLGRDLMAAAGRAGMPAQAGIGASKLVARVAAALPQAPTVVPAGAEAGFLARLPLYQLMPEITLASTLHRWGIRTIGDFARLPATEVVSRLGPAGQALYDLALGRDRQPLIPYQPPPIVREGMDLEWPLVAVEPFLFLARAALDRLCRRLESHGLACARLELLLRLEPHGSSERSLALPAPTRDLKTLLTLVRLELEARPPGAAVIGFTFSAYPDRPRLAQLTLFGPAQISPDRLATTLARLFALLGPDRVGSPQDAPGHAPERCVLVRFAPPPPPRLRLETAPGRGLLAVRVLRPPMNLEVTTGDAGEPRTLKSSALNGAVRVASGPWRLEEGWWLKEEGSSGAVTRDYWDVELSDQGAYRLFRDDATGEWFADGVYD